VSVGSLVLLKIKKNCVWVYHPSFSEKTKKAKKKMRTGPSVDMKKKEDAGNTFILHAIRTMGRNF